MPKNNPPDDSFLFSPGDNRGPDWRKITLKDAPEYPPVKPSTPDPERNKKLSIHPRGGRKSRSRSSSRSGGKRRNTKKIKNKK